MVPTTTGAGSRLPLLRLAYGVLGLVLVGFAIFEVVRNDDGLWQLIVFAILPDVALLAGMSKHIEKGRLHPRAVPLYNALHMFVGPVLLAVAALVWLGPAWLVAALAWGAHVAIDRAVGYGLRDRQGYQRRR